MKTSQAVRGCPRGIAGYFCLFDKKRHGSCHVIINRQVFKDAVLQKNWRTSVRVEMFVIIVIDDRTGYDRIAWHRQPSFVVSSVCLALGAAYAAFEQRCYFTYDDDYQHQKTDGTILDRPTNWVSYAICYFSIPSLFLFDQLFSARLSSRPCR